MTNFTSHLQGQGKSQGKGVRTHTTRRDRGLEKMAQRGSWGTQGAYCEYWRETEAYKKRLRGAQGD